MKYILLIALIISISSCRKLRYNTGHFEEQVVNFTEANSEFDDYNSTAPFFGFAYLFHFSSNRNSAGNDYDIVGSNMSIEWNKDNGTLTILYDQFNDQFEFLISMFDSINTPYNELGPFSIGYRKDINDSEVLWTDLLMYASDSKGNFDINFKYAKFYNYSDSVVSEIFESQELTFINSDGNELYPSFYGKDFYYFHLYGLDERKIEKLIYCSDKEGIYNIYEADVSISSSLTDYLKSNNPSELRKIKISSDFDDKCPFVNGNSMVFASNRPGGYGGYDLYYSVIKDGKWTDPINFGEEINTEFDEYRPIALYHQQFSNDLLIFSSNRPGGKGGYDLYYTGIKRIVN